MSRDEKVPALHIQIEEDDLREETPFTPTVIVSNISAEDRARRVISRISALAASLCGGLVGTSRSPYRRKNPQRCPHGRLLTTRCISCEVRAAQHQSAPTSAAEKRARKAAKLEELADKNGLKRAT